MVFSSHMKPANDNQDAPPRPVPLIGTLNIDTGKLEPAKVVQLLPGNLARLFPNDVREA